MTNTMDYQKLGLLRQSPTSGWLWSSLQQDLYLQASGQRGDMVSHGASTSSPPAPQKLCPLAFKPPDPQDFTEHMQNFFMDHCQDAFGSMSEILNEDLIFKQGTKKISHIDSVYMRKMESLIKKGKLKKRPLSFPSKVLNAYGSMLSDVLPAVPPALLGSLLFEELKEQRERMLFSEAATGGALAFVPFSQRSSDSQSGCLLYPGNQGLDCLNFQRVELQQHRGTPPCLNTSSSDLLSFQLKAPIRQISTASLIDNCCVAVRSDHLVESGEIATCVSVSPHVLGEVLVASESGAVDLWTVGKGMQRVREEEENLYFNAKSSWRWCEFSAHPRVMVYADRTGVELTDIRMSPVSNHTLFRISNTPECRSGERLILSRYLADIHPFHHLITTQHSAYIMDERFPCVPMLKWDHMMQSPPMFCHTFPGSASSRTAKVLLGSHSSQEITLLQYSGAPQTQRQPETPSCPTPSPPGAGHQQTVLTADGGGGYFLPDPGHEQSHTPPPALEKNIISEINPAQQPPQSLRLISETSSDEDIIGPTQTQSFVAETQEEERPEMDIYASSNESWSQRKSHYMKNLQLQVIVNDNDNEDQVSGLDSGLNDETVSGLDTGLNDETVSEEKADIPEEPSSVEEKTSSSQKLSDGVLVTWKQWLQKVMQKSHKNKPRPQRRQPFKITTEELIYLSSDDEARKEDSAEKELVENVRRDLRACMTNRSLLVHSAVSASLGDQEVVEVPNAVNTDGWGDPMSERLTVSWQGEGAWKACFGSSLSYQSDLSDFSDLSGWSSSASLGAWSDSEGGLSQAEGSVGSGIPGAATPSSSQTDTVVPTLEPGNQTPTSQRGNQTPIRNQTTTPQRGNQTPTSQQGNQTPTSQRGNQTPTSQRGNQTPSRTNAPPNTPKPLDSTPAIVRRSKPQEDYLSALFAPQDDPSLHGGYFLEEESPVLHAPPPVASSSSQSASLRSVRSGFSQSLTPSQSSQGRPGLSQAPLAKKKKPRMGF
ncbi:TATA box-binding protein-associated factor RNA polymerase I subunit C [Dissostichus eleginoides]|uniref:TATA box-binding protein-associated factor RNA polymerase I subunit C n=1 Tax=Dissostichus eleginoides TaxID=100907 RepID=A0AAD9BK56_DISEL|nr:TATA box-binding protein-associated factor RNA polymerase I subunit C [Dissostichus eleginoides]